ncbi:hypothetical protein ACFSWE_05595 [Leucobacter albus]|uniref:Uncharacterized protein n=1 Tax=Leucobacter albus TaxID=272210 RepID=A0ABW3TMN1_9MICO
MTPNFRTTGALLALGLLIAPLAACAPEPGTVRPDGTDLTEKVEPEGGSWPEENPDEAYAKSQALPDDFPDAFAVPEQAIVDDAGSRGAGTWFVVLRAADAAAATALWDEIVAGGGFTVSDEIETGDGGRAATLTSPTLSVSAVTLPGTDGEMLLSYDLTSVVG